MARKKEVLTNFLENLTWAGYTSSYDLLATDSSIRGGLSRDEWVELHQAWEKEADPKGYRTNFSRKLPGDEANLVKFEVGWSMSMSDTALNASIRELPLPTAINRETGRHWFWTTHTLGKEQDEWRVQSMTDEVAKARSLSIAELQKRVQQHGTYLDEFSKQHRGDVGARLIAPWGGAPSDLDEYSQEPDEIAALEEARWRTGHILAYYDALIEQEPQELAHYQLAAMRSLALNEFERSLVYFDLMLERFPEMRGETLLQLAGIQIRFIRDLENRLDIYDYEDELIDRIHELAEANLRESIPLNDTSISHLLLAELLKDDDKRLDEAGEQLRQAKALAPDEEAEAMVEREMGTLAMIREEYEQALEHYSRVAEIHPDSPKAWADRADAYNGMEHFEEAEASYRHAIELKPDDINLYVGLSTIYMASQENDKSRELWEEALRANPDSANFRYYLAMTLAEQGQFQRAQELLEEAEEIDPDSEMAFMIDTMLNAFKTTKLPTVNPDEQAPPVGETLVVTHPLSGVRPPTKFSRKKAHKRKKK